MSVSLVEAQAALAKYVQAEQDVLDGKTVEWGNRQLTMPDLGEIRAGRREWQQQVTKMERAAAGYDGSRGFAATANFDE